MVKYQVWKQISQLYCWNLKSFSSHNSLTSINLKCFLFLRTQPDRRGFAPWRPATTVVHRESYLVNNCYNIEPLSCLIPDQEKVVFQWESHIHSLLSYHRILEALNIRRYLHCLLLALTLTRISEQHGSYLKELRLTVMLRDIEQPVDCWTFLLNFLLVK